MSACFSKGPKSQYRLHGLCHNYSDAVVNKKSQQILTQISVAVHWWDCIYKNGQQVGWQTRYSNAHKIVGQAGRCAKTSRAPSPALPLFRLLLSNSITSFIDVDVAVCLPDLGYYEDEVIRMNMFQFEYIFLSF